MLDMYSYTQGIYKYDMQVYNNKLMKQIPKDFINQGLKHHGIID